jgi:hypothetical protein
MDFAGLIKLKASATAINEPGSHGRTTGVAPRDRRNRRPLFGETP